MGLEDESEQTLQTALEKSQSRGREAASYILSIDDTRSIAQNLYQILKSEVDNSNVEKYPAVDVTPDHLLEALHREREQPLLVEFLNATNADPTSIATGLKYLLELVQGDLQELFKKDFGQALISSSALDDYIPGRNVPPPWEEAANFVQLFSYTQPALDEGVPKLNDEVAATLPSTAEYWRKSIRFSPESFVKSLDHKGYDVVTLMHELTENKSGKGFGRAVMESKLRNIIDRTLPKTQAYLQENPDIKPNIGDILDTAIEKLNQIRNGGFEIAQLQRKVAATQEYDAQLGSGL